MTLEILIGIALVLGIVNLVMNIITLKKVKFHDYQIKNQTVQGGQAGGAVFCRKCNAKYSAILQKCPSCGAVRK